MTIEEGELLRIGITIASITYSVVFGIVAKKVWDVPKIIDVRLNEFEKTISERINTVEEGVTLAQRRVDVHDRVSSKIVGKDFDSHTIIQSGVYPEVSPRVR